MEMSVLSFRPECCSASQRNGVQLQTGIAFTFDRIPQKDRNALLCQLNSYARPKQEVVA
jgi:hypothetical protein